MSEHYNEAETRKVYIPKRSWSFFKHIYLKWKHLVNGITLFSIYSREAGFLF